jgi:hypothetical protein
MCIMSSCCQLSMLLSVKLLGPLNVESLSFGFWHCWVLSFQLSIVLKVELWVVLSVELTWMMFKVKLLVALSVKLSTMFKVELAITLSFKLSTGLKIELSQFEEVCHFFSKICHMNFILHAQFPLFLFNDLWFFVFNYTYSDSFICVW